MAQELLAIVGRRGWLACRIFQGPEKRVSGVAVAVGGCV